METASYFGGKEATGRNGYSYFLPSNFHLKNSRLIFSIFAKLSQHSRNPGQDRRSRRDLDRYRRQVSRQQSRPSWIRCSQVFHPFAFSSSLSLLHLKISELHR